MNKPRIARSRKQRGTRAPAAKAGKSRGTKRAVVNLISAPSAQTRRKFALSDALEFYRPLKKPVTLRLDADVLAWFKKDGRRYQTRINGALRKVMEREMKNG